MTAEQPVCRSCGRDHLDHLTVAQARHAYMYDRLPVFRNRFHRAMGEPLYIEVLDRPWDAEEMDAALLREYKAYRRDSIGGMPA